MAPTAQVFISYSHESDQHRTAVLEFANRLRADGVDAMMDMYAEAPPEGWPRWVERQISASEFVICVCSDLYRTGFEGRNDGSLGLGVNQEGFLILQDLYEKGNRSTKYIPVLFQGTNDAVPGALRPYQRYSIPWDYDKLYSRLTHQSTNEPPPLGTVHTPPAASPKAALQPQSSGFEQQADVAAHLLPSQQPLERLAPSDGFYLSRIINPQPDGGRLTTVWIAARGSLDYVLDSVRIRNRLGRGLGPGPSPVALAPDAEYQITFPTGSDASYALNPALMIGPSSRNWAWFTLSATRDNQLIRTEETTTIWLQYHASDGGQGVLVLTEVPVPAARLAKIAGCDILYRWRTDHRLDKESMVVAREGLQRGFEEGSTPAAVYAALELGSLSRYSKLTRNYLTWTRSEAFTALQTRAPLHDVLRQPAARSRLSEWLCEGSENAADLIGSLADEKSTAELMEAFDAAQKRVALLGLCIRHAAAGDDVLATFALDHLEQLDEANLDQILLALTIRSAPSRVKVFLVLRERSAGAAWSLMKALEEDLSAAEKDDWLKLPTGPLGADLFLYGSMNNWTPDEEVRLTYDGRGIYTVQRVLSTGSWEIKIGGRRWIEANLGAPGGAGSLQPGCAVELVENELSANVVLQVPTDGLYRFELDARQFGKLQLAFTWNEATA